MVTDFWGGDIFVTNKKGRGYIHGCRVGVHVSKWLHGSPSRFSANSAICTAAGSQHTIAIHTAAIQEQFQTIYMAIVCLHNIAIYTAAIQELNRLYTLLPVVYKKTLFTRQPLRSQLGYIHCCRVYIHEIVIYTAAVQEPNRLYTLLPCS